MPLSQTQPITCPCQGAGLAVQDLHELDEEPLPVLLGAQIGTVAHHALDDAAKRILLREYEARLLGQRGPHALLTTTRRLAPLALADGNNHFKDIGADLFAQRLPAA